MGLPGKETVIIAAAVAHTVALTVKSKAGHEDQCVHRVGNLPLNRLQDAAEARLQSGAVRQPQKIHPSVGDLRHRQTHSVGRSLTENGLGAHLLVIAQVGVNGPGPLVERMGKQLTGQVL